jgi:Predicted transcriptional regulator
MRSAPEGFGSILRDSGSAAAEIRRREALSQADLAELTGLHVNTIANFERGLSDPSLLAVSLIYIYLRCPGVSVDESGCYVPLEPRSDCMAPLFSRELISLPMMASIIGARVRERRLAMDLCIAETAKEIGIHPNTLWNLEKGLVAPSVSTSLRLYRRLGITRVVPGGDDIKFF